MNILLLTSTIQPRQDQPELKLVDVNERLADYERALESQNRFLERRVVDRIVYVDNSGYDLAALMRRFPSSSIEWISFYGLDYDPSYHRGYGEFRLIDHAFAHSKTLSQLVPDDRVWKVTGRYVVRNLDTIIRLTPRQFDLYCDMRGGWVDMGFMAWSAEGYARHIRGLWQHFATPKVPELILAERLREAGQPRSGVVASMYWPPFIVGRRGANGTPFQGRFTPIRFALNAGVKAAQWPIRAGLSATRQFRQVVR